MKPGHSPHCRWDETGEPCQAFSTDGTRLGADIAHTFGTTSEDEIRALGVRELRATHLTGVRAEQADWDGEDEPPASAFTVLGELS